MSGGGPCGRRHSSRSSKPRRLRAASFLSRAGALLVGALAVGFAPAALAQIIDGTFTIGTSTSTVTEGEDITITFTRDTSDLDPRRTVAIETSGGAAFGIADGTTEHQLSWGIGVQEVSLTFATTDDTADEADATVTFTLLPNPLDTQIDYGIGGTGSVTVTVQDNDGAAMTDVSLVKNLGQGTNSFVIHVGPRSGSNFWQAQRFTTGDNAGGYTLSEVKASVGSVSTGAQPIVGIYTATSGDFPAVGTLVYTLTNPASFGTGEMTWTAPANATLAADTNYFLVFRATGASFVVDGTSSSAEDAGGASGWSIFDSRRWSRDNGSSWRNNSPLVKIEIRGTAVTVTDTTAPTLSTAAVNGATLTLTYDEALDTNSVPAASAFTVLVGGVARTVSDVAVGGSAVTLTLSSAVTDGQTVTLSYTVPASNPIQDAASNGADALTNQAVTNNTDTIAPALSTATPPTVDGATLVLTYDEALDGNSVPAADAFTVKVDDSAVALANTGAVAISGSTVTLTLAAATTAGQTVTVGYAVPATGPVQDLAGNDAAALTDQAVINTLTPAVTVTRSGEQAASVTEGATGVGFTFAASPEPAAALTVNFRVSGGDAFGVPTDRLSRSLEPGSTLSYAPSTVNDVLDEADSDLTLTVVAGTGYRVGTPASAAVTIHDDDALPGAPSITSVAAGATQLTVAWSAPADPGYSDGTDASHTDNTVTAYDVRHILSSASDKSDAQWTVVDDAWTGGDLEYALAGLAGGESHDVQVRAVTQAGDGPWSGTSTGTPTADTTPPTLSTAAVNSSVLTLTYDEGLDTNSVPAASAFSVTVDAFARTVSNVAVGRQRRDTDSVPAGGGGADGDGELHGAHRHECAANPGRGGQRRGGAHRPGRDQHHGRHGAGAEHGHSERCDPRADLRRGAGHELGARGGRLHGGGERQRGRPGEHERGSHQRQNGNAHARLGGGAGRHGDAGLPAAGVRAQPDPGRGRQRRGGARRPGRDQHYGHHRAGAEHGDPADGERRDAGADLRRGT